MRLLFLFVAVPFIELFLLLQLAELISGWRTFVLIIVTGIIGAELARRQGWSVIRRIQSQMQRGQMPTTVLADALMIFVAGALLVTPGILTDVVGFSLLIPACRAIYRRWMMRWIRAHVHVQTGTSTGANRRASQDQVIDSYVVEKKEEET